MNYIIGNDPAEWHTDLPTYAGITYSQLYDGIDLTYSGTEGHLKSTYTIAPGADPSVIRWSYTAISNTNIDAQGNLQLTLSSKDGEALTATEAAPVAWQTVGGTQVPVVAQFKVYGDGTVGFIMGVYDRSLPLVLDPTLLYSTYLGGTSTDRGQGIAIDSEGNMYVTGPTLSSNFPITNALQPFYAGGNDAFVTKLSAAGTTLIYSTYLGSTADDQGQDIAVNSLGEVYLIGSTTSASFPITKAVQLSIGGGVDGFITKLDSSGSGLLFSTFVSGSGPDHATRLALDAAGNAYVVGDTRSSDFPTHNAYQGSLSGIQDVKIEAAGATEPCATYFGGSGADTGYGIAVDSLGNAYLVVIHSQVTYLL